MHNENEIIYYFLPESGWGNIFLINFKFKWNKRIYLNHKSLSYFDDLVSSVIQGYINIYVAKEIIRYIVVDCERVSLTLPKNWNICD